MGGGPSEDVHPELTGHLLFTWTFEEPKESIARLRACYPNLKITFRDARGGEVDDDLWASATILSTTSALPSHPSKIPKVKFIHLTSAGVNHLVNHPIYTSSTIPLTTSSGIHGPTIAEWVTLTLLSHAHRFPTLLNWQDGGKWIPPREAAPALAGVKDYAGQRLAVLGYGSIGRQVARVAKGLGMDVFAYTASPRTTPESRRDTGFIVPSTGDEQGSIPSQWFSGLEKEKLHAFLGQDFDVLVICVPLTPATEYLLGKQEFDILARPDGRKPMVINIARGKILVQSELVAALKRFESTDGKEGLRAAAVDVTDPEPLPEGDELWKAPNAFVSPHISGYTDAYAGRSALVLEGNVAKLAKGEKLWNEVDRGRGY